MTMLDAKGMCFKDLNIIIKNSLKSGENIIHLKNIEGQRYIGGGIQGEHKLVIQGTPGNDMAAYMDGPEVIVNGNAQDAMANTMNNGRVIVHGNAGDTAGYAMRGGEIFIKGNVGYRVGIHMKEYSDTKPVIVIGGKAGNFLGEYMAGGIIILLGLGIGPDEEIVGDYCGTGMHGGVIYVRGEIPGHKLGKEVMPVEPSEEELRLIAGYVERFSQYFGFNYESIMANKFTKLYAYNKRPYGNLYAY